MAERITVAGVVARLGFELDSSGARRFEEEVKEARRAAERPIEAELTAHVKNEEAFNVYARKLREAEERAKRKGAFQAALGADFDAKAFASAERELAAARKKAASDAVADKKAEVAAVARAQADGVKDAQRLENERITIARRGADQRVALVDDLVATIRGREEELARSAAAIDRADTAERIRRASERTAAEIAEGERRLQARTREAAEDRRLVDDLAVAEEHAHAERKRIAEQEFEEGKRRRQIQRIDEARSQIPLLQRLTGRGKVTTQLGFEVDEREFLVYERRLREAEALASRKDKYKAHLGADFDEGSFKAAEGEFRKLANAAEDTADAVGGGGGGGGGRRGSNLGASFFFLRGKLESIARIAAAVAPALAAIATEVVALVSSLTAAVAGLGALGIGLVAALGPVGIVIGAFVKRANLLAQAWKATSTQSAKSGVDAQAAATRQRHAAEQITAAQRGVKSAHDGVRSAERALADAHENVAEAQDGLTDANFKARREMEDLRREVDRTATSEKRANLSLEEALTRLRQIQDDPHHRRDDLLDARLAVEEAKAAAEDAATAHKRATQDSKRGTDTVISAQKQLKTAREGVTAAEEGVAKAQEGVKTATEGVAKARRDAADAAAKESGAANTALQKLGVLSKEEKSFLEGFKEFLDVFSKAMRPATDAIFGSLGRAFKTTAPLLKEFSGTFVGIGKELGKVIESGAKALASPAWRSALTTFAETGTSIIQPLSHAIGSFFETIRNIAVAAQPLVKELATNIDKWFGGLAKSTSDVGKTRDYIKELVKHTKDWVTWLGQVLRLFFNVFSGGAEQGRTLLDVWTKILRKWNDFLETKEGRAELIEWFKEAHKWSGRIWVFVKGIAEGFIGMAKHFAGLASFFGGLAGDLLNIKEGTSGIETIGKVLGAMALLKLSGVTKLLGLMLGVGKGAKGIAAAFAAFKGISLVPTGGRGGGGGGGGIARVLDVFKARGSTFANPLFVYDVSGGPKGPGGVLPGGGKEPPVLIGKFPRIRGLLKGAGKLGAAATAIDVGVNLVDSKGNPIAAAINSVHDLTFGLTPKVNVHAGSDKALKGFNAELNKLVEDKNIKGLRDLETEFSKYSSFPGGIDKARIAIQNARASIVGLSKDAKESIAGSNMNFDKLAKNVHAKMTDVDRVVRINSHHLKGYLGTDSRDAKEALAANFRGGIDAVKRQMRRGEITTKEGMEAIRGYLVQELQVYGLSLRQARNISRGRSISGGNENDGSGNHGAGAQSGGWIGGKGIVGPDNVEIAPGNFAARGEYLAKGVGGGAVINRHQAPYVDLALARGGMSLDTLPRDNRALPTIEHAMSDVGGLGALFAAVRTPHMMATGGMVAAANRLDKAHFPYVWGGGHQGSPAPYGPMDCSGAVSYVLQQGGVKIPTMTSGMLAHAGQGGPGAVTVFANPEHTFMRIGRRYFGTSGTNPHGGAGWFPDPGEEYRGRFTQRHFAGNLGGLGDIARVRVRGGGGVGRAAQRALDIARGGARRTLRRIGLTGNVGDVGPGAERSVVAGFRRAITSTKARPVERLGLWEAGIVESGLRNLRSGDADSLGALQERASIYGRAHALNPFASATRFLQDAIARRPWRGSAGSLAAAVQRPRADLRDKYDEVAGQARRYFRSGGAYSIGKLRAKNTDRIKDFDAIMDDHGTVARIAKRYETQDRIYDQSAETLVNDDGSINQAGIDKRVGELQKLIDIRKEMVTWLDKAITIAKRVVRTYSTILGRLKRSLRHAKKKDRSGIRAQIADFTDRRGEWRDKVTDVTDTRRDARLDLTDIQNEKDEVFGTKETSTAAERYQDAHKDDATPLDYLDAAAATAALTPDKQDDIDAAKDLVQFWKDALAAALLTPDPRDDTEAANALGSAISALADLTAPPDATANQQAIIDQLTTANEALAANLAASESSFAALSGTGDIGTAQGANAYASAQHDAGVVLGPGGHPVHFPVGSKNAPGGPVIVINQHNLVPGSTETMLATGNAVAAALAGRSYSANRTEVVG